MTEEHRQQTACQQKCANNNWDHVPTKRHSYIAVRRDFSNEKLVALDRSLRRRDRFVYISPELRLAQSVLHRRAIS